VGIILAGREVRPQFLTCWRAGSIEQRLACVVPEQLRLKAIPDNPALPPRRTSLPSQGQYATETRGTGAKRIYLDIQSAPENIAYPPRPVPGSVADFDVIMDHCDFSEKKVC
jgi:WD repeat and SOF domain-containing protein 1